jgi:hypothetical protein
MERITRFFDAARSAGAENLKWAPGLDLIALREQESYSSSSHAQVRASSRHTRRDTTLIVFCRLNGPQPTA